MIFALILNYNRFSTFQFINGTQLLTRCDFSLYYPDMEMYQAKHFGIQHQYLDRSTFLVQSASLSEYVKRLRTNDSTSFTITLQKQTQYICSNG